MLDLTDDEMLEQMQLHRRPTHIDSEGIESWIVDIDTGDFFIMVTPVGADIAVDHIKNCKAVMVELYDHGEMPDPETLKMPPLEINGMTITFDVRCFPHTAIRPTRDMRFKDRPWAKHFTLNGPMSAVGACTLAELCDIVRYCVRLPGLKVFL
jgi:hypothetical protein